MKTQKRQVTITDLYNLVAHETVSLLEAVDDNAIPLALEMREGLTMLAAAAGSGEGVETHLEWIDQEIENLKQTAGTPQCVTHLIPTSQLVRTVAIDAQIDMTLEFFGNRRTGNPHEAVGTGQNDHRYVRHGRLPV